MLRKQALLHMPGDFQFAAGVFALLRTVGLFLDGRKETRVVPGLLNEVDCPAPHRFDGQIDARPRGHYDHRHVNVVRQQFVEQREPSSPEVVSRE